MKQTIYTLALVLGLGALSTIQATELDNVESSHLLQTKSSNTLSSAYYYSDQIQLGIAPNDIVKLTHLGTNNSKKFGLSYSGGIIAPYNGNYLISYRVLANTQISLALYVNGHLIPESAFAGTSTSPVFGSIVVSLNKNDVLTIQNIETAKTFNTMIPVSTYTPTIPVSVTVQCLDN